MAATSRSYMRHDGTMPASTGSSVQFDTKRLMLHDGEPERRYSTTEQWVYRTTSVICTTLFLMCLLISAMCHAIYEQIRQLFTKHIEKVEATQRTEPRSPQELRLLPDLNYYFQLYGLRVDHYDVVTEDGHVLTVHRIVDPRESGEDRMKRLPMLCIHGLLQSSGSFCSGGKESLAYFFHMEGYDVWLGNNRCGFEARHTFLSPNDFRMWDWDIKEMAYYDLPVMIDHVLATTDSTSSTLSLMCHSQGTTQGFITLDSDKCGLNAKINSFIALAPAVYGGPLLDTRLFIRAIAMMSQKGWFFGINSFLPIMMTMRRALIKTEIFGKMSYMMFNYLFGWNNSLWDKGLQSRHFLFSPVYVSVRLMSWWLNQMSRSKSVLEGNRQWFNDSSPPVFLVIPRRDLLVDGAALANHMDKFESTSRHSFIVLDDYSHLDVLWARNVIEDVGMPILAFLKTI